MPDTDDRAYVVIALMYAALSGALVGFGLGVAFALWRW